jgi:hypothetical protein
MGKNKPNAKKADSNKGKKAKGPSKGTRESIARRAERMI